MTDDRLGPIIETAVDRIVSVASASGYFELVQSVEPKSAPGNGLMFATWIDDIQPIAPRSGLNVTSARVPMTGRIYGSMLADPQERIDIEIAKATSFLLALMTEDFGVTGAYIDLLGMAGAPLGSTFGYVEVDRSMFRISDILIPFIADNVFDQGA